ncbi:MULTISPECIES: nucleotidyltransferase substrate binding protein [unclassified Lonepinella]|uniref:nucleotidyltransferase substrate binding protein n=1 Tax=unclassified Lonepinella TaxID=2642006 RepID=UPI0036DEE720
MDQKIIRLKQRFEHYKNALARLSEAIEKCDEVIQKIDGVIENIVQESIIQRFEFTHELAWKLMKDILQYEGDFEGGSRTATREAFNLGYISQGEVWMDMVETRNLTVHTYNISLLNQEFEKITTQYFPLLLQFEQRVEKLCQTLD